MLGEFMPQRFVHLPKIIFRTKLYDGGRLTNLFNIHLFPILANLWLETTCLLERSTRPLRAGSNILCEIRTVALKLKNQPSASRLKAQSHGATAYFERLEQMLASRVSFPLIENGMGREISKSIMGISSVIEENAMAGGCTTRT
jgi:hypothetical protein